MLYFEFCYSKVGKSKQRWINILLLKSFEKFLKVRTANNGGFKDLWKVVQRWPNFELFIFLFSSLGSVGVEVFPFHELKFNRF